MLSSLTPRAVLAGCTGLLLLGGIAGAATVDPGSDGDKPKSASAPGDTSQPGDTAPPPALGGPETLPPVTAAPGRVTTATTSAARGTPAAGATTTTTRAGRSTAPGPLVPPKAGDYVYEATSTSPSGTKTERTTTRVEPGGTEGPATIQAVTIPLDLGGQRAVARNTVAWNGGALVRRSIITAAALGQQQLDCVWQPAFLQYAANLAVGQSWSFDTRCSGKIQGFDITIQQRATRRVTGTAQVAGPAGAVATWTVADDTSWVLTSPLGVATVHMVGTMALAPSIGLPVRSEARVEASSAGSPPEQSTLTTKLVALP